MPWVLHRRPTHNKYAPQTFAKAQQLYETAQQLEAGKGDTSIVVQDAREAVETAEDARMIAERRSEEEKLTRAQAAAAQAQTIASEAERSRAQAERQIQLAQAQADEAQARADSERTARERAEADAAEARADAVHAHADAQAAIGKPQATVVVREQGTKASQSRMSLLEQLNGVLSMRDTARGLMATVPDSGFSGTEPRPEVFGQLGRLAKIAAAHPDLRITVEGNSDTSADEGIATARALSVRSALVAQGVADSRISAKGVGDGHLFGPNSSAAGRAANRRVEIIISGDSIGDLPFWDHPYALTSSR